MMWSKKLPTQSNQFLNRNNVFISQVFDLNASHMILNHMGILVHPV